MLFWHSLLLFQADIVAQTKIVYEEKELLHLIRNHLMAKGCDVSKFFPSILL